MAQFSTPRQPRYATGRRRRPTGARRPVTSRSAGTRRRGPAPILIIAGVIIALIFCWIFGRGCGGNQQAKENERLRTYTATANKVIERSAAVGGQFDTLRKSVKDISKADITRKLSVMVDDSKSLAGEAAKVEVPKKALGLQPLLKLSLDLRAAGVEKYRVGLLDVLEKKNTDAAAAQMSQGLMDLVVSDEALQRFRADLDAKLKAAKLTFEKVADSTYVPKKEDAMPVTVQEYIAEIQGTETGNEIHGVAVVGLSTSPARVDRTESGLSVLPFSKSFTVKVSVQNQGNQEEEDIPVVVTLTQDPDGTPQKKTQKIARLKPNDSSTLVFEDLKPVTGGDKENVLTVKAGPVKNEKKTDNNEQKINFTMQNEGE